MEKLLLNLIQYLFATFGPTSEPKKQGSVGFLIWKPKTFAQDKLDKALSLAEKCDWSLIASQDETSYYDEKARQHKIVPPHIYIGPTKSNHKDVDAALAYALKSSGLDS